MFYPQLVAGPIERPQNLIHQFYEHHVFNFERFKEGLTLISFGLFKKVVIADRLTNAVDYSYANIGSQSGLSLLVATFFYTFQIYCDFSGYSDIAIGSAKIMGFNLMENFRTPYFSESITEFWHRWHISSSSWFRDYLYIPLGGNRVKLPRLVLNLFFVFLVSGIWHGANWTFAIWGCMHCFYIIIVKIKNMTRKKLNLTIPLSVFSKYVNIIITFSLVSITWVFFRSNSVENAFTIIKKIINFSVYDKVSLFYYRYELIFCFLLIIFLCIKEFFWLKINVNNSWKFFLLNVLILFCCYFFGVFNLKQFIYFQF